PIEPVAPRSATRVMRTVCPTEGTWFGFESHLPCSRGRCVSRQREPGSGGESPLASEKLTNLVRVTERRPPVWIPNQVHRASRIDAPASGREREDREVRRRGGEEERVEAVEHAAVRAEEAAAVFHARV